MAHACEEFRDLLRRQIETCDLVQVVNLDLHLACREIRRFSRLVVVGRDNLERLYRLSISSEHGNEHVVDNLDLGLVCGSDLNQHVLGVERDLAVVAVDDRG
jgi:hypothetical protein